MKTSKLDQMVNRLTAFRTWNDMVACMERGYVPTLNGGRAYAKLAGIVRRLGYKAFRNGIVA
ncbi:MAG TPA: hypothetical protein VMG10_26540 [Gemmataceae bacterium]|nr:hypothetical protein [Gemmataceae bacterium]